MTTVTTARLLLRPSRLADVPDLFSFLGDPVAMRLTQTDPSLPACRRRIAVHEWRRRKDGFAPWTALLKSSGRVIGWGGLYDDPFDPGYGVEIGYFLHPNHQGHGLASELVRAALDEADHRHRLPVVRAFARPENHASQRVLAKAGFTIERYVPEMSRHLFRRDRPAD